MSAASTPAQPAKPVCSVAPVRQQPNRNVPLVQPYQWPVSSALYNPMASQQPQQAQRLVFVQAPSVVFSSCDGAATMTSSASQPASTQATPVPGGHSYAYVFGPPGGVAQQQQQQQQQQHEQVYIS